VEAGCAVRGDDPYKNPGLAATLMNAVTLMKTAAMAWSAPSSRQQGPSHR